MERSDFEELHNIAPISNVVSILEYGILSYHEARNLEHISIAMNEIQMKRGKKKIPGTMRPLHSYANLYFHARNPMMYKRRGRYKDICVLRISTDVLDIPGTIIADGNAASDYTGFWPSLEGLGKLDKDKVFSKDWRDTNQILQWQKANAKCAEVLVPDIIDSVFIAGAFVAGPDEAQKLRDVGFEFPIDCEPNLFFR